MGEGYPLVYAHKSTIRLQGNVLSVAIRKSDDGGKRGKRGGVGEWSRQSRNRLIRLLNSIEFDAADFLTLTFHENVQDHADGKRCLKAFLRAARDRYALPAGIWRQERQERGALHYHVIILDGERMPEEWVSEKWTYHSGESLHDEDHLRYGARLEKTVQAGTKDGGLVVSYFAKYVAKEKEKDGYENGRVWGQWGCENKKGKLHEQDLPLISASVAFRWVLAAGGRVFDNISCTGGHVYLGHVGRSVELGDGDSLIALLHSCAIDRKKAT